MRQLLERLRQDLSDFVAQRNAVLLEVSCRDEDAPLVFKALGDLDRGNESDLFLLCMDDFETQISYVSSVLASVRVQLDAVAADLEAEGRPPLPPPPAALDDPQLGPAERLIRLFEHARQWIPADGGHRVIWGLFPFRIADCVAYQGLLHSLSNQNTVRSQTWMRATRLVGRAVTLSQKATPGPYSRRIFADFSPPALEAALATEAVDPSRSEGQRIQSLLTLAQLDSAHGRPTLARSRFKQVIEHAEQTQNHTLHALALNALGELAHREGDLAAARAWYECAVAPACSTQAPILLALLSRNLGDLAFLQGRFAEAEGHYDAWQRLAAHLLDAEGRLQALHKRALCQLRLARLSDGRESLESAAQLGRSLELWGLHRYTLVELGRLYGRLGELKLRNATEQELRALPAQEAIHA